MEEKHDLQKTVVVALDICKYSENFGEYSRLSTLKKTDLVNQSIRNVCNNLSKTHPMDKWIISWREYGVSDESISDVDKKIFESTIQNLCKEFPNLLIISGNIKTRKEINLEKAKEIHALYDSYQYLAEIEEQQTKNADKHYIKKEREKINSAIESASTQPILAVRSTAFLFNAEGTRKHDKLAPTDEAGKTEIHHPAKEKNKAFFFRFGNETIGIEICREHHFGLLRKEGEALGIKKPLFHFVLSDTIALNLNNAFGKFIVHIDSLEEPTLILSPGQTLNDVVFYVYDLLSNNPQLVEKEAVYPFKYKFLDEIEKVKNKFSNDPRFNHFKEETKKVEITNINIDAEQYDAYKYLIERGLKQKRPLTYGKMLYSFFIKADANEDPFHTWLAGLSEFLNNEKASAQENSVYIDLNPFEI
ncbi:TPA: hypothetical protein ACTXXA_003729 [Legionella anisa]